MFQFQDFYTPHATADNAESEILPSYFSYYSNEPPLDKIDIPDFQTHTGPPMNIEMNSCGTLDSEVNRLGPEKQKSIHFASRDFPDSGKDTPISPTVPQCTNSPMERAKNRKRLFAQLICPCLTGIPTISLETITHNKTKSPIHYLICIFVLLCVVLLFAINITVWILFGLMKLFKADSPNDHFEWVSVGGHSRGVIAIGSFARGIIAIGQFSFGVVTVGQLCVGLVCIGQAGIGVCGALGMVVSSCGPSAGMLAVGFYTRFSLLSIAFWDTMYTMVGFRFAGAFLGWKSFCGWNDIVDIAADGDNALSPRKKTLIHNQGLPIVFFRGCEDSGKIGHRAKLGFRHR